MKTYLDLIRALALALILFFNFLFLHRTIVPNLSIMASVDVVALRYQSSLARVLLSAGPQ